jgi:hypothetical protein
MEPHGFFMGSLTVQDICMANPYFSSFDQIGLVAHMHNITKQYAEIKLGESMRKLIVQKPHDYSRILTLLLQ